MLGKKIGIKNFIILTTLLICGLFGVANFVYGESQSSGVNVQMTVPNPPGGDPGPGAGDASPVISNVTTTPAATSSVVTWTVTDDHGLSNVTFNYSADLSYDLSAFVSGNYRVNLTGLTSDTVYYFKIVATDTATNVVEYTGSFTTLSDKIKSLKIYAKPEKRVSKPGGNLALNVTVVFYNPATQQVIYTLNTNLDKTGSSNFYNITMPTAIGLEAVLKGESHLAKKIVGVNLVNGQNIILDFTDNGQFALLAGDVQGTGLKDNFVDILDVSAENVKFNGTYLNEDLNRDGVVDVLDMSMVLVNFNRGGALIPS